MSASKGKGQGNGSDESCTNSQVKGGSSAGDMVILQSGGDTTLQGAVVAANQVKADIGGNLNIESLQDSSNYASKQQNFGGSLSIGYGNMSGSISASKSNVNSDFNSVTQQSGIKTGDGGFQVDVAGNTDLKGAVIASTDTAVNFGNNSFTTGGTLTTSDIQNTASYSGKSTGISVGTGYSGGNASLNGTGVGIGKEEGNASSTTSSGISGIAANTAVRSTDPETGIARIFDADKVQREINAQVAITQHFGQHASKAVGDYAEARLKDANALRSQAQNEPDGNKAAQLRAEAKALEDNWGDTGTLRLLAHTTIGGLTGGAGGAAGAAAGTLTAPTVAQALRDAGVDGALASTLTALASTAVGATLGGTAGAGAALNEVANNFLTHAESSRRLQLQAELVGCKDDACRSEKQAEILRLNRLDAWRDEQIEQACTSPASAACQSWTAAIQVAAHSFTGQYGNMVDLAERSSVLNQAFKYQQAVNNPFMQGVGKGLLKLTPPGLVVGLVGGIASTAQSIAENGLTQTVIDSANAIAGLPADLKLRLNSSDPTVRGEALVDLVTLGTGATALAAGGTKLTLTAVQKAQVAQAVAKAEAQAVTNGGKGGVGAIAGNGEGLFTNTTRVPYAPANPTLGQAFDFSCAAASCKMAANLTGTPEAYIRSAILTDGRGTSLANIPSGLKNLGFTGTAEYSAVTTIESISAATKNGASVIVNVRTETGGIHALVVDSVKSGMANIRDPWPLGTGSSYSIPVDSLGTVLTGKGVAIRP